MKPKVLFIDRDGTLIAEPPSDFQIDSLEKLEFIPGVFRNLYNIRKTTDYKLVLVSNQDGLGTDSFPEYTFRPPHEKFLQAFKNEGVLFDAIYIDPSMPEENSPNRKPGTGMLKDYINGDFDLENSFVIGDRLTDLELAKNLGAKGIMYGGSSLKDAIQKSGFSEVCALRTQNWDEIAKYVRATMRSSHVLRKTNETSIDIHLSLDGSGEANINTGLGFFDHMLEQIPRHGNFDLRIDVKGDLHVDEHHTIEDTALALGEAFLLALGNKMGICRYGFTLPMDDSLAQVAIDFGGRPWLIWEGEFKRDYVGDVPTEMFYHFFKSFSDASKTNLNIKFDGQNDHHKVEGVFKAFSKSLSGAVAINPESDRLPSTKGKL